MPVACRLLRRLRHASLYLLLLSPACTLAADGAFHITQGPLEQALRQWSRQSGDALLFDARELKGLDSTGISGNFDAATALEKLLQGLPVKLLRTPAGVFVVRRQSPSPAIRNPPDKPASAMAASATRTKVEELAPVNVTGTRLPRSSLQTSVSATERGNIASRAWPAHPPSSSLSPMARH